MEFDTQNCKALLSSYESLLCVGQNLGCCRILSKGLQRCYKSLDLFVKVKPLLEAFPSDPFAAGIFQLGHSRLRKNN